MYSESLAAKQAAMREKYSQSVTRKYAPKKQGDDIVKFATEHPELTWREIAQEFGCTLYSAYFAAKRRGYKKPRVAGKTARLLNITAPKMDRDPAKIRRQKQEARVLRYVQRHPEMTYDEIGEAFGLPKHMVGSLVYRSSIRRAAVTDEAKARNLKLAEYVKAHPELSYSDMSRALNLPTLYIARIARAHGLHRGKGHGPRHNQGRSYKGAMWSPEDRARISKMMVDYWSKAPEAARKRLSNVLKNNWTPQSKAAMSRALKSMWRAVL